MQEVETSKEDDDEEASGKIVVCLHDEKTGICSKIADVPTIDPLELEKQLRAQQEKKLEVVEDKTIKMETLSVDVMRGLDTVLQVGPDGPESEERRRMFLAEADVVGRSLEMGNMEIGEARNAYYSVDPGGERGGISGEK